jgi:integrase
MPSLRIKYVNLFETRWGKPICYFRRGGVRIPLTAKFGSATWWAQYTAALNGQPLPPDGPGVGAERTIPRSLDAVVVSLMQTADYQGLAHHSKRSYQAGFKQLREHFGKKDIRVFEHAALKKIFDGVAKKKPGSANELLRVMRAIFKHARTLGYRNDDPTTGLKKRGLVNAEGHYSWLDEDIERYRAHHPLGTTARLALEIALNTGLRRSDLVLLGRQHVRDGKIRIKPVKTAKKNIWVSIPVTPALRAAIDAMPPRDGGLALLGNPANGGRDYSADTFGKAFAEWCNEAGLPPQARAHGLRKAIVRILVDLGVEFLDIMAITGHRDPKTLMIYARDRNQAKLAERAMGKMIAAGGAA